jgi:hypothetical protein
MQLINTRNSEHIKLKKVVISAAGINCTTFMAISLVCGNVKIAKISSINDTERNAR